MAADAPPEDEDTEEVDDDGGTVVREEVGAAAELVGVTAAVELRLEVDGVGPRRLDVAGMSEVVVDAAAMPALEAELDPSIPDPTPPPSGAWAAIAVGAAGALGATDPAPTVEPGDEPDADEPDVDQPDADEPDEGDPVDDESTDEEPEDAAPDETDIEDSTSATSVGPLRGSALSTNVGTNSTVAPARATAAARQCPARRTRRGAGWGDKSILRDCGRESGVDHSG